MKVKCWGKEYDVTIRSASYAVNDNYAVILTETTGEPFATLTVNLENSKLTKGYAFVDTNNCPWAEEFIKENNLGEFTGATRQQGYCVYPLYRFNTDKIKERI